LRATLERSQDLGFLGPGPLDAQVHHALGFVRPPASVDPAVAEALAAPGRFLDLGSGGGLPGLVLACLAWPDAAGTLVDAGERRCEFLGEAVTELGLDDRVTVVRGRAEEVGRSPDLRARFDVVVVRSFGPPAVTAECAAPFVRESGAVVVSEPPPGPQERWPSEGLALLGLEPAADWSEPFRYQALRQSTLCPDRYPRRVGIPAKRPLF
jgi:16S rRNA (guanine527-N7)-methyltransferase